MENNVMHYYNYHYQKIVGSARLEKSDNTISSETTNPWREEK